MKHSANAQMKYLLSDLLFSDKFLKSAFTASAGSACRTFKHHFTDRLVAYFLFPHQCRHQGRGRAILISQCKWFSWEIFFLGVDHEFEGKQDTFFSSNS